jgi:hypothetical protein
MERTALGAIRADAADDNLGKKGEDHREERRLKVYWEPEPIQGAQQSSRQNLVRGFLEPTS